MRDGMWEEYTADEDIILGKRLAKAERRAREEEEERLEREFGVVPLERLLADLEDEEEQEGQSYHA